MKSKINPLFFITLAVLFTFACLGGAPAAKTPSVSTEESQPLTAEPVVRDGTLEIVHTNSYIDSFSDFNVSGEIVNNTNETIENLTLSISIMDEAGTSLLDDDNGAIVDSLDFFPHITVLAPGEATSFNYYISADEVKPADFKVAIKEYDTTTVTSPLTVSFENMKLSQVGDNYFLTGEVVNPSSQIVDVVSLSGALTDSTGNVLATNFTTIYSHTLFPASDPNGLDRGPFLIEIFGPLENVSDWKVYAHTTEYALTPAIGVETQITSSYIDTYGSYHLVGTITNNGTSQIAPAIIGNLYAGDKTVIDASSTTLPFYLNVGETAPFDLNYFQVIGSLPADQAIPAEKSVKPDLYWTFETTHQLEALEATSVVMSSDGYSWEVTGTTTNTSGKPLGNINVIFMSMDGNGAVSITGTTSIYPADGSSAIEPGDTNEFRVTLYAPEGVDLNAQDYEIIVQGVVLE